jgi:hypothetical protein
VNLTIAIVLEFTGDASVTGVEAAHAVDVEQGFVVVGLKLAALGAVAGTTAATYDGGTTAGAPAAGHGMAGAAGGGFAMNGVETGIPDAFALTEAVDAESGHKWRGNID